MPHATHPGFTAFTWLLGGGLGFLILLTLIMLAAALIARRRAPPHELSVEMVGPLVLTAAFGLSSAGLLAVLWSGAAALLP